MPERRERSPSGQMGNTLQKWRRLRLTEAPPAGIFHRTVMESFPIASPPLESARIAWEEIRIRVKKIVYDCIRRVLADCPATENGGVGRLPGAGGAAKLDGIKLKGH